MPYSVNRSGRSPSLVALAATMLVVAACTSPGPSRINTQSELQPRATASSPTLSLARGEDALATNARSANGSDSSKMVLGTNAVINIKSKERPTAGKDGTPISLNFENGDIREIARNMLGDVLGDNFVIDPAVTGTVSIRTAKPVARSNIVPLLEGLLRSVRAVLVRDGDYWRVLPETAANLGTGLPRIEVLSGGGNGVTVLPVQHIGAKEMERVLLPFARTSTPPAIRVDELRNLLFLTGTEREVRNLIEISEMFDVDMLSGMSFLLHPLESTDVKVLVADWEKVFPAGANPFMGLLRVIPIERMNAVLLVSPRRETILQAKTWLERLDAGGTSGDGVRLYVYHLQYSQADKLQAILQQALGSRGQPATAASVAPGQTAVNLSAPISPIAGQPISRPGNAGTSNSNSGLATQQIRPPVVAGAPSGSGTGLARNATIVADKDRNALLIVSTPSEYASIEGAIRKLDVRPKQIAIEVQIAEVTLDNSVSLGFAANFLQKPDSAVNRLTSANGSGTLADGGGFSYIWQNSVAGAGGTASVVKAALNTLQGKSQARTIAAPILVTLDNQKVSFTNGSQISVQTQSTSATTTTGNVNSFQYIDTGLTINVTPRVTGNNIFLEIEQQNSSPGEAKGDNPNPPITRNSQSTSVMVANGDTMLLGGLFLESGGLSSAGLPGISTVPVFGALFGNQKWRSARSEVVMLITPRILSTIEDTREVVDELRRKMGNIEQFLPAVGTLSLPSAAPIAGQQQPKGQQSDKAILPAGFNRSLRLGDEPASVQQ